MRRCLGRLAFALLLSGCEPSAGSHVTEPDDPVLPRTIEVWVMGESASWDFVDWRSKWESDDEICMSATVELDGPHDNAYQSFDFSYMTSVPRQTATGPGPPVVGGFALYAVFTDFRARDGDQLEGSWVLSPTLAKCSQAETWWAYTKDGAVHYFDFTYVENSLPPQHNPEYFGDIEVRRRF